MSAFSDSAKHRLIAVGLLNLEDKPELLSILKCYFEGIWNISDSVVYEKTIFMNIYTYVDNYGFEHIFSKFESQFHNYVRNINLYLLNQNSHSSYRYISLFNSGVSAYVDKHKLDQYFQDYAVLRRVGFSKDGCI